ncbi:helicase C-terminal domain-containing protein [Cohnella lupini]|uniref:Rad3-related DNA helicase n=1 Tax=Cohnella lupini TaxID=1294267 RepID=A0A3D9I8H5_9BACL|nr:helicase C-terminal domain-containing protein [Cohnella lupini]RED58037.1 Rad3-related DNA helicase [Cohnella lupini]
MPNTVALSVRGLVEYAFLSGSIDSGFRSMSTLAEGTKAHQKIQKQYGEQDRKEVYLSAEIPHEDLLFVVDGRCDGLLIGEDGGITIDEIKSTARDVGAMTEEESYPVHWAQAYVYAYMYALESGARRLRVRLTYVQVDTEEQRRFEREVTMEELVPYVERVVERYAPYARMLLRNKSERDESIAGLRFPFAAYREGQKRLVGSVYKAIEEGRKLFAKAPTGIGKTISTLYPAIKAIGLGKIQHIFYLTARTITRTAAEDALSLMNSQGLKLRSVTVTAKDKICFRDEVDCRKEMCPYADGYYDRINDAILDLLDNETLIRREEIEKYARKHMVCPFEMSLDAAYGADAVICDYNYLFDPRVSLKRLTGERKHETVLLVDEAHNLIDRAREMYSAELNKKDFLELEREFKGMRKDVHATARAINKWFIEERKRAEGGDVVSKGSPGDLLDIAEAFVVQAERELTAGSSSLKLLEAYFATLSFIRIGKLYDASYVTYTEVERNDVRLKMFCMNPAQLLKQMGKGFRAHVFFSATLSPLNYFMDMLGAEEEDYSVTLGSPFAKEQWEVSIAPISTRYVDREETQGRLVDLLCGLVAKRSGNYLFFFPSYAYMNGVYEVFMANNDYARIRVLLQTSNMAEEERESFLAAFSADNTQSLVGFAVMGGIFSEGIDLVGDRLTGVAVVGVGMPQLGLERNLIKSYFDDEGRNGFDYAYVYPGINKVLQAGGRLIRSERDRGVLALIDDRYLQSKYNRLLPEEWREPYR